MYRFINDRKNHWKRLEELLSKTEGVSGLRMLPRAEVRELGELYRRAASDLAIARAESRDPKLISYLNSLVIRAHGKIYRAEGQGANLIWKFISYELPTIFRETFAFTFTAFAIFTVCAFASFYLCLYDQGFIDTLGVGQAQMFAQSDIRWWEDLNQANQVGSSEILTNNINVAFLAFAFGASLGIGTIYILAFNGLFIGGVLGACYKASPAFAGELAAFMVGHGVVELSCIFIAGGAGLMIGYSIFNPGEYSRIDSLKTYGLKAVKLAVGCAIFLVIAGVIEGFLSPSNLPVYVKTVTGVATGAAMFSYLLLAGRKAEPKFDLTDV
ncbi:MAG: stage II sporulation protein M [Acidobacteria bacterium]|nr:MAG: stage II sporulation protein M [Acidobacteriota bacterium]REJ98823.1 MAG: stage II sporulation protein M [Acidobacteriota bacterium]REK16457.1 MAG: stage II sporulation protein M [Acidobacteriota bacterium]REK44138.1 MAG: stage II sporulation protein M [Acidobacteriota bacterium]